jgi:hypothetical protein
MLFNDPPKHTRLRRLVTGAFKPPVIAALRERITALTDELLDALPAQGEFELMAGFAQQLPVRVICDVLGLPPADFAQTKLWSDALAVIVEPVVRREQRLAAGRAAEEMAAYLRSHIAERRAGSRRDDLLSLLVAAQDGEGQLTADELLGNLILLFIAGHETTTNLIGNGLLTLLRHPAELARLRADPALTAAAVEEMLRYEGSVTMVSRMTVEPYAIGDTVIPPEEVLYFMLGPANRDPAVFADPSASTSAGRRTRSSASAPASISASAPRSRGSRRDRVHPAAAALPGAAPRRAGAALAAPDQPARPRGAAADRRLRPRPARGEAPFRSRRAPRRRARTASASSPCRGGCSSARRSTGWRSARAGGCARAACPAR